MKRFTVQVSRKVEQFADLKFDAASPNKAKAIAEYEANLSRLDINWESDEPRESVRIRSKVIKTEEITP